MSKILVGLETPKGCEDCPFYYCTEGAFSNVCQHPNSDHNDCGDYHEYVDHRPEWCPFNATEKLRVLGEPSQCDPRFGQLEDRDYIPLKEEIK